MIEYVHEHIIEEIKTNTRTDTIFVLASIILNLVTLAINSAFAGERDPNYMVMSLFTVLIVVVNLVAVAGLLKGRQTHHKLVSGLLKIYKDNKVDGYYDQTLLGAYKTRYILFIVVVLTTGVIAGIVPFILL
ncbi:MAG: hypothetical protein HQ557_10480 [Bacteroidetes bacterium]|nr:hypothetical protein [Bacteroidota bacterium]